MSGFKKHLPKKINYTSISNTFTADYYFSFEEHTHSLVFEEKVWITVYQEHQNIGNILDASRYFVSKIVLTYCEKNCSSDREKRLKFEAEGREFAKFLRSLEQFIHI